MKLYELVDLYIIDRHSTPDGKQVVLGSTFRRRDLDGWLDENGYEVNDVGSVLTQHRKAKPRKPNEKKGRLFTTMRVGMGPDSRYVIVENQKNLHPKAVRQMAAQWGNESVDRALKEAEFRMRPLLRRSSRARTYFKTFEKQTQLLASLFGRQIQDLLDEEAGE